MSGDMAIDLLVNQYHETRDGVRLAADIIRPSKPGRYPVILMRTPYDKIVAQTNNYAPPHWFARHGYVVVTQDVRGRGASGGEFYPFAHEADDGVDCIEWARDLSFSNGRVGMYGLSYPGVTQMQAARMAPEGLRSIAPAMTSADYHDGWTYRGGALELAFAKSWATLLAMSGARRANASETYRALASSYALAEYDDLPLVSTEPLASCGFAPFFRDWLEHPTRDDYWTRWALEPSYGNITAAGLHVGGWWDIFLKGTLANFTGMKAAGSGIQRCVIGPWTHAIDESQLRCPSLGGIVANPLDDLLAKWFDLTLRDGTDMLPQEPVQLYVLRGNRWLGFDAWPPPGSQQMSWFLDSDGKANSDRGDGRLASDQLVGGPPDTYVYDPLAPVPSVGGASCCSELVAPMGPAWQAPVEALNDVLVYTTTPFTKAVVLAGPVSVVVFASTSGSDTDLVCRLCVVDRDGRSLNISDGILRGRYREGLDHEAFIEPNYVYEYAVELQPICVEVHPGEKLRLQITSSGFPRWDRNMNTGGRGWLEGCENAVVARQSIYHTDLYPSRLTMAAVDM